MGGLRKTEELVSESIEPAAAGVLSSIREEKVVNGDDTHWEEDNSSAVLCDGSGSYVIMVLRMP